MSNRRQPQRLPPPIMHGPEAIDAEVILREHPEDEALVLWKTARTVRLWAEISETERSKVFETGAHGRRIEALSETNFPQPVALALGKAAGMLQPRARSATVAAACRTVSEWAAHRGAMGTAIEFMQAAAVSLPMEAELAYEVTRLARANAEYARSETWYRQAISRARRTQNWYDFARSYIGLGAVFVLRGNYPQAKRSLIRGLRAAKRFSIRPLIAAGYHEMAVLGIHRRNAAEVNRFTQLALETYSPGDPKLPALAFDYGEFLLSLGHFAEALRIFKSLPAEFGCPDGRLAVAAAKVRSAGAVNDRQTFDAAWRDAEALLSDRRATSGAATALLALARGAESIGDLDRAERAAIRGQSLAGERGEAEMEFVATGVLESIRSGAAAAERADGGEAASPKVRKLVDEIANSMTPSVG